MKFRNRRYPVRAALLGGLQVVALVLWSACSRQGHAPVELELGAERFQFVPESAFAEYWELPGEPDQLRITLASYKVNCESYRGPAQGQALVTLTVRMPAGKSISPGEYPWNGLPEDPSTVPEPQVIPFVRLAREGRTLAPGGALQLRQLDRSLHGLVQADFVFSSQARAEDDAEQAKAPSSGLRGSVSVRLCRLSLDPGRTAVAPP